MSDDSRHHSWMMGYYTAIPFIKEFVLALGFPGGSVGRESACNAGDVGSIPGSGRFPGGGQSNPCLETYGQRSLSGYSPWGPKELDTTEVTEHACAWGKRLRI